MHTRKAVLFLMLILLTVGSSSAYVIREKTTANDTIAPLNTTWTDDFINTFNDSSVDFTASIGALLSPFTDVTNGMGVLFYAFVYLLPVLVIWIRQEKVIIPVGLGIIFGGILVPSLPEAWQGVAEILVVIAVVGILYSLFKER